MLPLLTFISRFASVKSATFTMLVAIRFVVFKLAGTCRSLIGLSVPTPIRLFVTSNLSTGELLDVFDIFKSIPLRSKFAFSNGPDILPTCDIHVFLRHCIYLSKL